ncbi:glycosyl transferase [Roseovarius sp. TE539]|uniref:glycosyltransferase n=1 Tax=Roseovarius sp. TE539 TaxID=2249812 RepID=UPI000DDF4682|nr:glycosyltransferase [Roseovarius sp. TE539]RBI75981.1 glycosyl transferase [Roseovarius sp. TE539]
MGISELRQLDLPAEDLADRPAELEEALVESGSITRADASLALMVQRYCAAPLDRVLEAEGLASEAEVLDAQATARRALRLDEAGLAAASTWPVEVDPRDLLRHGMLPLAGAEGRARLATARPSETGPLRTRLPREVADAPPVIAPRAAIQARIARDHRDTLTEAAQARVPESESCRSWLGPIRGRLVVTFVLLGLCVGFTLMFPAGVFTMFAVWAGITLVVSAALKMAAFIASVTAPEPDTMPDPGVKDGRLPKVSILVPLFRETEIAHALIARLSRLTYPKCLLDVVLVLEEKDALTQQTLASIDLPPWMRAVVVPDGQPRTKPRAMNYALDFCEGDIVGIFDAEDAPDPDQITRVARRFQTAPPDLVCLQGILDYYNPRQNWLARCFTIEYATWFRVMLPGMSRLGLAIPLGGTTLYFRRHVLEELGGWDAHNVTEDADLGFRLARHGYRTEMINTVTAEEANCRAWPWIRQRSRWLKGYMTTYLVHMRNPRLLFRQLGPRKFWGFQAHFVSALSQFILAPFLWSFWLLIFGLPHPLDPYVARSTLVTVGVLFLLIEVFNVVLHMTAVSGREHRHLMAWAPTMHFYAPLGAVAAYKALYEMVFAPFFWDKTRHGHSLPLLKRMQGPGQPSDKGVDFPGIKLEPRHESL